MLYPFFSSNNVCLSVLIIRRSVFCRYEVSRKKARSKAVGERQKLKHKVRKETKVMMECTINILYMIMCVRLYITLITSPVTSPLVICVVCHSIGCST